MTEIIRLVLEHPIASWIIISTIAYAVVEIVKACRRKP